MKRPLAARLTLLALLAAGLRRARGLRRWRDETTTPPRRRPRPRRCRTGGRGCAGPDDPLSACNTDLATTVVDATGAAEVQRVRVPKQRPIDCFYVYPTVTSSPTGNAPLRIGPEVEQIAIVQAAQFERVCRVYAPRVPAGHELDGEGRARLPRRARGLARLPGARQQGPRRRADRAFAGRADAQAADPERDRRQRGGAQAARLGDPARRQRRRRAGLRPRRRLRERARLPDEDADRAAWSRTRPGRARRRRDASFQSVGRPVGADPLREPGRARRAARRRSRRRSRGSARRA